MPHHAISRYGRAIQDDISSRPSMRRRLPRHAPDVCILSAHAASGVSRRKILAPGRATRYRQFCFCPAVLRQLCPPQRRAAHASR